MTPEYKVALRRKGWGQGSEGKQWLRLGQKQSKHRAAGPYHSSAFRPRCKHSGPDASFQGCKVAYNPGVLISTSLRKYLQNTCIKVLFPKYKRTRKIRQKENKTNLNISKDLNRLLVKVDIHRAARHRKRSSTIFVIWELQIKTMIYTTHLLECNTVKWKKHIYI